MREFTKSDVESEGAEIWDFDLQYRFLRLYEALTTRLLLIPLFLFKSLKTNVLLLSTLLNQMDKPVNNLLWRTHFWTMIGRNTGNIHLLSTRLLDSINTLLLYFRRNTLVVLAIKIRRQHIFVSSMVQLITKTDARVLRKFLARCKPLFGRQAGEHIGCSQSMIMVVQPTILHHQRQFTDHPPPTGKQTKVTRKKTYLIRDHITSRSIRPLTAHM
jgi:hypothetical protein